MGSGGYVLANLLCGLAWAMAGGPFTTTSLITRLAMIAGVLPGIALFLNAAILAGSLIDRLLQDGSAQPGVGLV